MQLPVGGDDLPEGQPPAERAVEDRAREAPAPRPLGRQPGAVVRVGAPEPNDRQVRPRRDFRGRTGPRGAGRAGAGVSRRDVLRDLSGQEPGRGRDAEVLQAVLLPGPHRQSRHARNTRLDPRRRRAWLQPLACLRHGARQPRSDCRLRRGRRRGGDRAARHRVAFEQIPQSRPRWCGAAHPQSQRLQDRQSDGPVADQPRGARSAVHRLRLHAVFRGRKRSGSHASEDGRRRWSERSARFVRSRKRRARRTRPSVRGGR